MAQKYGIFEGAYKLFPTDAQILARLTPSPCYWNNALPLGAQKICASVGVQTNQKASVKRIPRRLLHYVVFSYEY